MSEQETKTPAKAASPAKTRKKKAIKQVATGCVYIHATFNNTIVTITDTEGNVLSWSSAGHCGFRGPKKATPYAASVIVKDAVDRIQDVGLKEVYVFVRGVGQGRESAVRALNAQGVNVLSIKDVTPVPHNGCRPKRQRKV